MRVTLIPLRQTGGAVVSVGMGHLRRNAPATKEGAEAMHDPNAQQPDS